MLEKTKIVLDPENLQQHLGHKIAINNYADNRYWENLALECLDCDFVIADYDYSNEEMEKGE
jgi:hypothetical protein